MSITSIIRQKICGLHGHDSLLHFEEGRISLLCTSCGHETPGWDVRSRRVDVDPRNLLVIVERRAL